MKRAVAYRMAIFGDAEIGDAIAGALVKPLDTQELAIVQAELERTREELERVKEENAQLGVRTVRYNKDFKRKTRKLKRKCPIPREPCKVAQVALVAWAIGWLVVFECFKRLQAMNRGAL